MVVIHGGVVERDTTAERKEAKLFLGSLVQNHHFEVLKQSNIPSVDFLYRDFIKDVNSNDSMRHAGLEETRFWGSESVCQSLTGKRMAYTTMHTGDRDNIVFDVDRIAPRLGLVDHDSNVIAYSSTYPHLPVLLVAVDGTEFIAYVVKTSLKEETSWFEFTEDETHKIEDILIKKTRTMPYRSLLQRVFRTA